MECGLESVALRVWPYWPSALQKGPVNPDDINAVFLVRRNFKIPVFLLKYSTEYYIQFRDAALSIMGFKSSVDRP